MKVVFHEDSWDICTMDPAAAPGRMDPARKSGGGCFVVLKVRYDHSAPGYNVMAFLEEWRV